jgi:hypothetical protein
MQSFSCSVACWKTHKAEDCTPISLVESKPEITSEQNHSYNFPTEDTVPLEKLQLLGMFRQ